MLSLLRFGVVIWLLTAGHLSSAASATGLVVNCIPSPFFPPGVCWNHTLGQRFTFFVVAVDAAGQLASNYTGTVSITSSDPTATLPPSHTFTLADDSIGAFEITLNSLSPDNSSIQTVTATDPTNGLSGTGSFYLAVPLPSEYAIPTLSVRYMALFGALLCTLAVFLLRGRTTSS